MGARHVAFPPYHEFQLSYKTMLPGKTELLRFYYESQEYPTLREMPGKSPPEFQKTPPEKVTYGI
jgi:hypothetical protein